MKNNMLRGYFYTILSTIIFGCMPLGAKLIYADGINPISLVFWRNFLALPALAFLAVKSGGGLKLPKGAFWQTTWVSLFGCCITPILLFMSYRYISSGTATVIHFVYPAITAVGSILVFREKAQKSVILCVILCTVGIGLFYDPGDPLDLRGAALALISGVTFAIYILLLSNFSHKEIDGYTMSFYTALIAAAAVLILCLVTNQLTFPSNLSTWLLTICFALFLSIGAVRLFQMGTFLIGGPRASILGTFEPITSLILGILVFDESINFRTAIGVVLILGATILNALSDLRKSNQPAN